jgi:hypothetical protein
MPYMLHESQYANISPWLWVAPRPMPVYRHAIFAQLYAEWLVPMYDAQHTLKGFLLGAFEKVAQLSKLLAEKSLLPILVAVGIWPGARGGRGRWIAIVAIVACLAVSMSLLGVIVHYASPFLPLVILLGMIGLRRITRWLAKSTHSWIRQWGGLTVVGLLFLSLATLTTYRVFVSGRQRDDIAGKARAELTAALAAEPGDDLIVVRYLGQHNVHDEWVYNWADIDGSAIVWAHDMGPTENRRLLEHFAARRKWLLTVTGMDLQIVPYRE